MTPAEIKAAAEQWFAQQMARIECSHGASWPEHREWIEDLLRAELRERLVARGWRPAR